MHGPWPALPPLLRGVCPAAAVFEILHKLLITRNRFAAASLLSALDGGGGGRQAAVQHLNLRVSVRRRD